MSLTLKDIAPSVQAGPVDLDDVSWEVSLDQIQSGTGQLLERTEVDTASLGPSKVTFDESNVLYSKLRPYLNKVLLPEERGVGTSELIPLQPDPDQVERKYLWYYLRSSRFVAWASHNVSGANLPRVNMKAFWKYSIDLPSLPEQRRIVKILERAEMIQRKRRSMISELDELLGATFLKLFSGELSDRSSWVKLSDYVTGKGEYGSGAASRRWEDSDYRYIRITDIQNDGLLNPEKVVACADEGAKLESYRLKEGDLLFARTGATVGKSTMYRHQMGPSVFAGYLIRYQADESSALPEFLWGYTRTPHYKAWVKNEQRVVAQPNISAAKYRDMPMPLVSLGAQEAFSQVYHSIWEIKRELNALAEKDGELVASLQSKLLS